MPLSRMMRSAAGLLTTVAMTVSAQSSSARRAEADLGAVVVDVVAGPQLGDARLRDAEAGRRRGADADLVDGDAARAWASFGERAP